MNRRLLLLSYGFPPASVPEAFLSAKRLGNMPGFDVDVICVQAGSDIRADHSLDAYVAERFHAVERLALPPLLHRLAGGKTSAVVQIPGFYHLVNRKALHTALRRQPDRYDAMMTWSQWHSVHFVGLALKKRFPKLPWIAHFSDPWADNPFNSANPIMRAYDRHRERKIFESADVLSLTSPETVELVFVGSRAKYRRATVVVPHVFDPVLYPDEQPPQAGRLVIRSLGAFYGARSPEPLFQALAVLREREPLLFGKMRVELIGSVPSKFLNSKAQLSLPPDTVRVLPQVDYRSSLGLMRSADLLLNIDAPFASSPFLPSKLVDYIGAGRPIFGITPPGAAARVIRELGGWVSEPEKPHSIATSLAHVGRFIESNRGKPWGDAAAREQYASGLVGQRFSQIVEQAIAKAA